jgi:hypothetical protein
MFVPRLEVEHAAARTGFDRVDHYVEYLAPCGALL